MNRTELLERASRCYQRAGLPDDAVRCLDASGQLRASARLLETLGRTGDAALRYEQAGAWREAAECHRRSQQHERCAECRLLDGDWLEAAWIFSHLLEQPARARALVQAHRSLSAQGDSPATQKPGDVEEPQRTTLVELILARCAAGMGESVAAARTLWRLAVAFPTDGSADARDMILERALTIAEVLERPDLSALLFAAGFRSELPNIPERWRQWAEQTLGDSSGIPDAPRDMKGAAHG